MAKYNNNVSNPSVDNNANEIEFEQENRTNAENRSERKSICNCNGSNCPESTALSPANKQNGDKHHDPMQRDTITTDVDGEKTHLTITDDESIDPNLDSMHEQSSKSDSTSSTAEVDESKQKNASSKRKHHAIDETNESVLFCKCHENKRLKSTRLSSVSANTNDSLCTQCLNQSIVSNTNDVDVDLNISLNYSVIDECWTSILNCLENESNEEEPESSRSDAISEMPQDGITASPHQPIDINDSATILDATPVMPQDSDDSQPIKTTQVNQKEVITFIVEHNLNYSNSNYAQVVEKFGVGTVKRADYKKWLVAIKR